MKNLALNKLQTISTNSKLPHAWLFSGADFDAQLQTAQSFSSWLVCAKPINAVACGVCKSCQLYAANSHPDICNITLQEDDSSILVDAIRVANDFVQGKPQLAKYKIVCIYPAEKMNVQAANALLKTLEEPPEHTLIMLLTRQRAMLLPTIISRCTALRFDATPELDATQIEHVQLIINDLHNFWLTKQLTPIQIAEMWVKRGSDEVLYWFELVLADLLVAIYTRDVSLAKFATMYKDQNAIIHAVQLSKLWIMLQKIQQGRYWLGKGMRPNLQLLLEDIMLS